MSSYSSCVHVLLTVAVNINVSLTYMHYVIRWLYSAGVPAFNHTSDVSGATYRGAVKSLARPGRK